MGEPYLGEIKMTGFSFAMRDWAKCDGALILTNDNPALFSLLGVAFGGNGTTNFNLPDLRGRVPIHIGTLGNYTYPRGFLGGVEAVTLNYAQLPLHTHSFMASADTASLNNIGTNSDRLLAVSSGGLELYAADQNMTAMNPDTITVTGGGLPHENMQPTLVINFEIALTGLYPPRS